MSPVKKSPGSEDPHIPMNAGSEADGEPAPAPLDPWRYAEAVYDLNRGLPHNVDFLEALG